VKAAKARLMSHQKRRPVRLLSGLLKCGLCGGGMSIHGRDRHGHVRVRCTATAETGACSNRNSVRVDRIENHALGGLQEPLREPLLVEEYCRAYHDERRRRSSEASSKHRHLERELDAVSRALGRLVDALAGGLATVDSVRDKILALEAKKAAVTAELAREPRAPGRQAQWRRTRLPGAAISPRLGTLPRL
jgi:hypothetical protein